MAFFGVTLERIDNIQPIKNADRIVQAQCTNMSFTFVVAKDQFQVGDEVVYFPIDSLIPETVQEKLGVKGKLAGKEKNRIKTVKLKGVLSQGIVAKLSLLDDLGIPKAKAHNSEELTKALGIVKYEPPSIPITGGQLHNLPAGQSVYDIEGADRNRHWIDYLMDQPVTITEKIEGSNFSVTISNGNVSVNQRKHAIVPNGTNKHTWWKVAENHGIIDFAQKIACEQSVDHVVVYGELIGPGIQNNIYGLKDHTVKLFDIVLNQQFMFPEDFNNTVAQMLGKEYLAPILHVGSLRDFLKGRTIIEASSGQSKLGQTLREGVVLKSNNLYNFPVSIDPNRRRAIVKQRDPKYLAKTGN